MAHVQTNLQSSLLSKVFDVLYEEDELEGWKGGVEVSSIISGLFLRLAEQFEELPSLLQQPLMRASHLIFTR